MQSDLKDIENQISEYEIGNKEELESFRLKFISRNGLVTKLFDDLKTASKEEKPLLGKQLNEIKKLAEEKFNANKLRIEESELAGEESDLTLPGRNFSPGSEHIIIQTLNEFVKIFREIGFKVTDGPELEEEFYNFDALNTPEHHPARDLQDTYYIKNKSEKGKKYVLRTHTSPVQIRTMLANKPPIRIICPGKVFRNETVTYKNYFMFHQVEALYVDKNVSMRDLKGVLNYFVKKFYGENTKTRFIPSFFPFTEPSAQLDISCILCKGKGCKTCKNTGWLEVGGCGMVDPNVFKAVGYDPEEYTGYAFGMGIERIAMLKYGIKDIRTFYLNDVRFLEQF
ncbi:MAG TPA: phenylalanine--tRNA ligase subunit alpha [Ignavibacteria bacterium]|jgi:phenylalanyl-tRNA synthetase alpha chain